MSEGMRDKYEVEGESMVNNKEPGSINNRLMLVRNFFNQVGVQSGMKAVFALFIVLLLILILIKLERVTTLLEGIDNQQRIEAGTAAAKESIINEIKKIQPQDNTEDSKKNLSPARNPTS